MDAHAPLILLVEDTLDLAQVIQRELEAAGFRTIHAPDGQAGLRLHAECRPDLVILDWMLPRLDGLEVLRRLRAEELQHASSIPVLMLTARNEEADRVIGLEVGADDYLTKPFSMRELIARVRAMLRRVERIHEVLSADRERSATGGQYVLATLELDAGTRLVNIAGEPVDLSKTEFDVLHLLLRNPGRAFSRAYLLDTVWGVDYVEGDRSVDNAMLRLRKKLGAWGDRIETVWGIGYRLRAG